MENRSSKQSLLKGLMIRRTMTDCPYGAFTVVVKGCSGKGDCTSVCLVNVFELNGKGECTVVNEALCFGCTACLAQCSEDGVMIIPNEAKEYPSIEDLLR